MDAAEENPKSNRGHHRKRRELRKSGATFKKIGDHFGISAQSAHEMVTKGLKATLAEPAAELRALAVERLDHMLAAIWKAASNGDLRAQAMVLRIEERRAKLLGLDATQRLEEVAPAEDVKASLLAKLNKMAERVQQAREAQAQAQALATREPVVIEHVPTPDVQAGCEASRSEPRSPMSRKPLSRKPHRRVTKNLRAKGRAPEEDDVERILV